MSSGCITHHYLGGLSWSEAQQKGERLKEWYANMGYEVFGFHYYEAVILTD